LLHPPEVLELLDEEPPLELDEPDEELELELELPPRQVHVPPRSQLPLQHSESIEHGLPFAVQQLPAVATQLFILALPALRQHKSGTMH
jgi:hypothetical protein